MEELIAKRYAGALSEVSKNLLEVLEVLNLLSEVINQEKVKVTLLSPIISSEKKTEMILASIGSESDKVLLNFIKVLGENGRLDLIPAITRVLNLEQQRILNKYEGVVQSNEPLEEDALKKLEITLKEYTGSTITLTQESVNLDGMCVSIDDLGIEVNFSKQRVKEDLIDFIKKSL